MHRSLHYPGGQTGNGLCLNGPLPSTIAAVYVGLLGGPPGGILHGLYDHGYAGGGPDF